MRKKSEDFYKERDLSRRDITPGWKGLRAL